MVDCCYLGSCIRRTLMSTSFPNTQGYLPQERWNGSIQKVSPEHKSISQPTDAYWRNSNLHLKELCPTDLLFETWWARELAINCQRIILLRLKTGGSPFDKNTQVYLFTVPFISHSMGLGLDKCCCFLPLRLGTFIIALWFFVGYDQLRIILWDRLTDVDVGCLPVWCRYWIPRQQR